MSRAAIRPQALDVLNYLKRWGSDTDSNIGLTLDVPVPSVRRSIQELIHAGYNVTYAGHMGLYTYSEGV